MHYPPPAPAAPSREPLSMQAGRLVSVATAASLALERTTLNDPRASESLALDLLDVVAILARRLASDAAEIQAQLEGVPA